MSRSVRTAAGARGWAPRGWKANAVNETGKGDPTDGGGKRLGVGGRSFVIHVVWNGFLPVGAECPDVRGCPWPACAPRTGVPADHAAGSGSAAAANRERNAEPATSAMKAASAATIAMAERHRVVSPPRSFTVARI